MDREKEIFSKNLSFYMDKQDKLQTDLIDDLGINKSTISTWVNGSRIPRMGTIQTLADYFGIMKSDLIEDKSLFCNPDFDIFSLPNILPIETKRISLLGNVACGELTYAAEDFECYVEVGAVVPADFALRAKGDSMIGARIHDGDIVFIHKQSTVENNQIAVVLKDDEATLKRFKQYGDTIVLSPENPNYDDIVIKLGEESNVRIIGRAIAFQSDVK